MAIKSSSSNRRNLSDSDDQVPSEEEQELQQQKENEGVEDEEDEEEDEEDEEEDGEDEEDEEEELERELADVPFEELQRARADGSHTFLRHSKRDTREKSGRANKNRPMEISSKAKVGKFREVVQVPKKIIRDPRFESLCGNLDKEGFRKRYNFFYEGELPKRKEELKKLIEKTKNPDLINGMKTELSWIDTQLKLAPRKNAESKILSEHIKKEREAVKQGKRPYYLKKSEIREIKLKKQFDELKAAGKLESYIEKRRKKNASKDHRYIPYRRSNDQ